MSKFLLLQTASPDSIVRLENTALACQRGELEHMYFKEQYHGSIEDCLGHHLSEALSDSGVLIQVRILYLCLNTYM